MRECLSAVFRVSGLPEWMLMDNGSPWGNDAEHPRTPLTVWLMRLGIRVSHGRPYHPQTQGKGGGERFHRTLKAEVLQGRHFADLLSCQEAFDRWRGVYNRERPHQALDLATPISRYAPSPRSFPETLPPIEYGEGDLVRKVMAEGWVSFKGREFKVGRALRGCPVALRPTASDAPPPSFPTLIGNPMGVGGFAKRTYLIVATMTFARCAVALSPPTLSQQEQPSWQRVL